MREEAIMRFESLVLLLATAVLMSACGDTGGAPPLEDDQATAVSGAASSSILIHEPDENVTAAPRDRLLPVLGTPADSQRGVVATTLPDAAAGGEALEELAWLIDNEDTWIGGDDSGMTQRIDPSDLRDVVPPRPPLPVGERWVNPEGRPHIAVTALVEGWTAIDIGCDGWLDWVKFERPTEFGPPAGQRMASAAMYVGPIYQDCPLEELIEGLPEMGDPGEPVTVGVGNRPAFRFNPSVTPDWDYLGVRFGPTGRVGKTLYLIDGEERGYFVFITGTEETFKAFSELAEELLETLELGVKSWG
jgi:hypothetical protein